MSKCAVHMMKMQSSALGGMESHNKRLHESKKNREIDYSKSGLNYNTITPEPINYQKSVKDRIASLNLPKAVRKDAVVMCSFIVSSDREFFERIGERETRRFFEKATEFFANRYGRENIICGAVHMDEATPHMHLGLVPVTKDGRLSAKTLFTPLELKQLQTSFAESVGAEFGLERGVEGSEATHVDELTFKLEKRKEEVERTENRLQELEARERELSTSIKKLEVYGTQLAKSVKSLKETSETLKTDISTLEAQKTSLERIKGTLIAWVDNANKELGKQTSTISRFMGEKALEFIEKFGLKEKFDRFFHYPDKEISEAKQMQGMSLKDWKEQIDNRRENSPIGGDHASKHREHGERE